MATSQASSGAHKPALKLMNKKEKEKAAPKGPAKSAKDWKEEEENESTPVNLRGNAGGKPNTIEQELVGSNYSIGNWGHPDWKDGENRFSVTFWFPAVKAAVDYPDSEEEAEAKAAVLKKLKVPYLAILPGQPIQMEEGRRLLLAQGAKISV